MHSLLRLCQLLTPNLNLCHLVAAHWYQRPIPKSAESKVMTEIVRTIILYKLVERQADWADSPQQESRSMNKIVAITQRINNTQG